MYIVQNTKEEAAAVLHPNLPHLDLIACSIVRRNFAI
jgi:hypothetical protein